MRKSPIRYLVYPLLAIIAWGSYGLLRILPIDLASGLGGLITRLIGPLLPVTRVAERNLTVILPELTAAERRTIIRDVWNNLGRVAGEFPHIHKLTPGEKRVRLKSNAHFKAAKNSSRPVIFFSGHFANWEMLPATAAEIGTPLDIIYRQANNPLVERLYVRARRKMARGLLAKNRSGAVGLLKAAKENHAIGMLVDQKMNNGVSVPFMGRPAMTAPAIAEIALKYNAVLHPVRMRRLQGAHFEMEVLPALVIPKGANHTDNVLQVLTLINEQLEKWIRQDPGQWLWLHRRWGKNL